MKNFKSKLVTVGFMLLMSLNTFASTTSDLPLADPLDKFTDLLTGPIVKTCAIVAIAACGFALAFLDFSSGTRKLFMIVIGLGVATAGADWLLPLFGYSGALIF